MKNTILYIALLCILHSILIWNHALGINVILFSIPFLIFLFYYLKLNKLVKNKKGFLFLIPIVLLSTSYLIYDGYYQRFNIVIIPVLYLLMFLYIMKPTNKIEIFIERIIKEMIGPFDYIDQYFKKTKDYISKSIKLSFEKKKKLKSILIVIPIVIVVLGLLSSADEIFGSIFIDIGKYLENFSFMNLIGRCIRMIILFTYFGSFLLFITEDSKKKDEDEKKIKIEEYTIKLLLTVLNGIYIIFDIIQVRSLMFHVVADTINYAEYARSGFFQLMIISVINVVIILLSKKSKESKYSKSMSILMILLTFIIIASSFMRMYLYEQAYGYTVLRLGVYISLITESILLIPTIFYILNPKINILNYYVIIITTIYTVINFVSIDQAITKNNMNRYYKTGKIDIHYLTRMNNHSDNIVQLVELSKKPLKKEDKKLLKDYLHDKEKDLKQEKSIWEYNISKEKAKETLKKRN